MKPIVTPLSDRRPAEPFRIPVNFWLVVLLIAEISAVAFLFFRPPPFMSPTRARRSITSKSLPSPPAGSPRLRKKTAGTSAAD
jgi:hypothetical protein